MRNEYNLALRVAFVIGKWFFIVVLFAFLAFCIFVIVETQTGEAGRQHKEYTTPWKYEKTVTEDNIIVTVVEKRWENETIESYDFALLVVIENTGKSGVVYVTRDEFAHIQRGDKIYVKIP